MITITEHMCAPLLVRFVLESTLDYPSVGDVDGRLACYSHGEGRWAVAWRDRSPTGIACITTLDDGPYQDSLCLYWLEVLPSFQRHGVGQTLLMWARAQTADVTLVIASTPQAAPFYRRHLVGWTEPTPNTLLVKGGVRNAVDVSPHEQRYSITAISPLTTVAGGVPADQERSKP